MHKAWYCVDIWPRKPNDPYSVIAFLWELEKGSEHLVSRGYELNNNNL